MQRVRRSTAVAVQPTPPIGAAPGFFTGGSPGSGVPATVPGFEWYNMVQEELVALVQRSGLPLDGADQSQVRRSLERLFGGGLKTLTVNTGLGPDDAGLLLVDASGGFRTYTLPAANAVNGRPLKLTFVRIDSTANLVTIQGAGSDTIEGQASTLLAVGERLQLVSDGAGAWRSVSGRHTQSLQVTGWQRFPSGLILQWGVGANPVPGPITVSWPIAFPNVCAGAWCNPIVWAPGGWDVATVAFTSPTLGTFARRRGDTTVNELAPWSVHWLALGF